MKDNAVSLATRDLTAAVDGLHATLRERLALPEQPQHNPPLHRPGLLWSAVRLCADRENGVSLAQKFQRVPESHVEASESRVRCVCGHAAPFGDLAPCPGDCGRYFASDESGCWVVRP